MSREIDGIKVKIELEGMEQAKAEIKELGDSTLLLMDNLEKIKETINGMKTDISSIIGQLEKAITEEEEQELEKLGECELCIEMTTLEEKEPQYTCENGVCHINFK